MKKLVKTFCCLTIFLFGASVISVAEEKSDGKLPEREVYTLQSENGKVVNVTVFDEKSLLPKEQTLFLPFASLPNEPRRSIDIPIADSSVIEKADVIEIDFECDKPEAVGGIAFYFHSGNGWYIYGVPRSDDESQGNKRFHSQFPIKNFGTEGKPDALNKSDKLRFAVGRGESVDATIKLQSIKAKKIEDTQSQNSITVLHRNILQTWKALFAVGDTRNRTDEQRAELTKTFIAELKHRGFDLKPEFFQPNIDENTVKEFVPRFEELSDTLNVIHQELIQKYCVSVPSTSPEFRAWWEHSGLGAYPGDWDRTMKELSESGFNVVIPNFLTGGSANYASDVIPRNQKFEQYGDQVEQAIKAGKKYGVEVHAWQVCWWLLGASDEHIKKMRIAGRTQRSFNGEICAWLCPSHPENIDLECRTLCELVKQYPDLDGIHFDYIRYRNYEHCYCDGCRERFTKDTGCQIQNWPKDAGSGGIFCEKYVQWRCDNITKLVECVHREAKKIRPNIKISAAVFTDYPGCRISVGQDWVQWIENGYLDFVCPMTYTTNLYQFESFIKRQRELIGNKIPLYPGIGATATQIPMLPDRVAAQIQIARDLNASGFVIFNLDAQTINTILPILKLGVTKTKP
jgi:uncharacterized lipoprotein YddW (UPF0748 family)